VTPRLRRLPALVARVLAGSMPGVAEVRITGASLELVGPRGLGLSWLDAAWTITADGRIAWPENRSGPGVTPGPADLATGDRDKPDPAGDQPARGAYHQATGLTSPKAVR
jgi:hypothetical protein